MLKSRNAVRPLSIAFLLLAVLTPLSPAVASDFTLVASPVSPAAVFPGGQAATSTINVSALNSVNPVNVALSCQVTPLQTTGTPICIISPASVTTPANPSLTITTATTTPSTLYTATVTGTDPSGTLNVPVNLTVLSAVPEYTLTITTALSPTSVHAGSGATAVLTLTPINGYTGTVTLSCSAITPAVTPAPTCAFNPASIAITTSTALTSTLTISTTGPHAAATSHRSVFYGLWLPLPGLTLIAMGFGKATKKRRNLVFRLLLLCAMAAGLLLLPACNTTSSSGSSTTGTPKNSYSFTVSGGDTHALAPSNGTQTVNLTVN
jgi:hypothetical protein